MQQYNEYHVRATGDVAHSKDPHCRRKVRRTLESLLRRVRFAQFDAKLAKLDDPVDHPQNTASRYTLCTS